jgi:hypothetical protein
MSGSCDPAFTGPRMNIERTDIRNFYTCHEFFETGASLPVYE